MFYSTITNSFSDLHKPTIGVDFHFRKFEVNGVSCALQLWDIAGKVIRKIEQFNRKKIAS